VSDIKLFSIVSDRATEIHSEAAALEKPLQHIIEANLEVFFGIKFVASEHATGKTHAGRIDTLGLDENNCPVIIEYKRSMNENVINQGLFYLDWLMDHKAEFTLLVLKQFGDKTKDAIDWSAPRLICIANDFTRYDDHAVRQISRNIELIRYRYFGQGLLLFELVNVIANTTPSEQLPIKSNKHAKTDKRADEWLASYSSEMKDLFESLASFLLSLGDDVQRKDLKLYVAFKKIRNFASVTFLKSSLQIYLRLNPEKFTMEEGFLRDVRNVGHWGTGNLEVTLKNFNDLDKAKPLLQKAYEGGPNAV